MERMKINGMSCQHCVASVKKTLTALTGISGVEVDLERGEVSYQSNGAEREAVRAAIRKIGFDPGE